MWLCGVVCCQGEDNEKYLKFWEAFGKSIKLGVIEDSANRSNTQTDRPRIDRQAERRPAHDRCTVWVVAGASW